MREMGMMVWVLCGVCWKCRRSEEDEEDGRKKERRDAEGENLEK